MDYVEHTDLIAPNLAMERLPSRSLFIPRQTLSSIMNEAREKLSRLQETDGRFGEAGLSNPDEEERHPTVLPHHRRGKELFLLLIVRTHIPTGAGGGAVSSPCKK